MSREHRDVRSDWPRAAAAPKPQTRPPCRAALASVQSPKRVEKVHGRTFSTSYRYRWDGPDLILQVQLQPRARRNEIAGVSGDRLKIGHTAPPVEVKANIHLTALPAQWFGIPKSSVQLLHGNKGRNKVLRLQRPQRVSTELDIPPPS